MRFFLFLLAGIIVAGLGGIESANAGGPVGGPPQTSFTIECPLNICDIEQAVQRVASVLFTVSIPVLSIMILIGGFQIMTAGGDEEGLRKGRKTILYGIIGFTVIFFAGVAAAVIRSIFS